MKPKPVRRIIIAVQFAALLASYESRGQYNYSLNFQTNTINVVSNWAGNGNYVVGSNTFLNALIPIALGVTFIILCFGIFAMFKGGENHLRMNIATSRKTLELALNNLANALKNPSPDRTLLND